MSRAPITKVGSERLRAELERLKSVERPAHHRGHRRSAVRTAI